ncbi:MAG: DUF1566 domain-containing protein [Pseudomonadota bacterium]
MITKVTALVGLLLLAGPLATAQAILIDSGYGLIYDDDLNITWLQDANFALTSGYDSDGRMTWDEANAFLAAMNTGSVGNFGQTGWRLPTTADQSCIGDPLSPTSCAGNEFVHLYYSELGNAISAFTNAGPFINLQPWEYWTGTEDSTDPARAWDFGFSNGTQYPNTKDHHFFTLLVHDGNIASVPEPSTLFLVAGGLVLMVLMNRGREKSQATP